jgi:hypothetical protein
MSPLRALHNFILFPEAVTKDNIYLMYLHETITLSSAVEGL